MAKVPLTVSIPGGAPTGAVFNGSTGFVVHSGASSGPARFLFSSEAGTITGWNPAVPPPPPSTQAQTAVTVPGAIFKGLAIADTATGPRLYATDFHNGRVDVWDANFAPVRRPGAFSDPALPRRLRAVRHPGGERRDRRHLRQAGRRRRGRSRRARQRASSTSTTPSGDLLRRFAARGPLNAPWGIALAPQGFGAASGALLIGNFGDGRINAYDPVSGRFLGALRGRARRGRSRSTGCGRWSSATA